MNKVWHTSVSMPYMKALPGPNAGIDPASYWPSITGYIQAKSSTLAEGLTAYPYSGGWGKRRAPQIGRAHV